MPGGNWERIISMTKDGMRIIGTMRRKISRGGKKIALLIDGPNILRKEFGGVKLEDIVEALEDLATCALPR